VKKFNVLTIFPRMIQDQFSLGIISKGAEDGLLEVNAVDVRDFATDKHKKTDDYQYGGGQGLLMKPEPIVAAAKDIKEKQPGTRIIVLDPRGKKFDQREAERLTRYDSLTFICGRYEGIDERVFDLVADESISIGDFVLTGGELGAMVVIDAVARLIPGVLGDENSCVEESFSEEGLLEYPHYTRPPEFEGLGIPDVLLSGHHAEIDAWRRRQSIQITAERRPEMLDMLKLTDEERDLVKDVYMAKSERRRMYLALMHYPMRDKQGDVVSTAITNMDLHDISRTCTTYALRKYFVVTPLAAQREIAERVMKHWNEGYGSHYNHNRKQAFSGTQLKASLLETIDEIEKIEGERPVLAATTARTSRATTSYKDIAQVADEKPVLLLFGTGWGFVEEVFEMSDCVLEPIHGLAGWNHLSVRAAVSIILDRINRY